MTPLWLDPTPAVRQFVYGLADFPVRGNRLLDKEPPQSRVPRLKDMKPRVLKNPSMNFRALQARKRTFIKLEARGVKIDWSLYPELMDIEAFVFKAEQAKRAEEMARMREKPHERKARQKIESQNRRRERERANRPAYSAKGNSKHFAALA